MYLWRDCPVLRAAMGRGLDLGLLRVRRRARRSFRSVFAAIRRHRRRRCDVCSDKYYHLATSVSGAEEGDLADGRVSRSQHRSSSSWPHFGPILRLFDFVLVGHHGADLWIMCQRSRTSRKPKRLRPSSKPRRRRLQGCSAAARDGDGGPDRPPPPPGSEKKWYIVNTYSGHENKAKLSLLDRVKTHNLGEYFGDVCSDRERDGERQGSASDDDPQVLPRLHVRPDDPGRPHVPPRQETPKITGFLGGMKPTPVPPSRDPEAFRRTSPTEGRQDEGPRLVRAGRVGPRCRWSVCELSAKVEEVKADKQKVKVSLSMFGRTTAVELDFAQVEKA